MSQKRVLFLSNLGVSSYEESHYFKNDKEYTNHFAQIAILNALLDEVDKKLYPVPTDIVIFTTEEAKENNYDQRVVKEKAETGIINTSYNNDGLKYRLEKLCSDKAIEPKIVNINIESQETEKGIQTNFVKYLDSLQENDIVYVDITNAMRSMPLIMLSAIERAKITKSINVRAIFYGTYNNRGENELILDLLKYDEYNNWSYVINQFKLTGYYNKETAPRHADNLPNIIIVNQFEEKLSQFSRTVYQPDRLSAIKYGLELKNMCNSLEPVRFPKNIQNLVKTVKELVSPLKNSGEADNYIYNLAIITRMCFDFKLYQSALTFLFENISALLIRDTFSYCHYAAISLNYTKQFSKLKKYSTSKYKSNYNKLSILRNSINHAALSNNYSAKSFNRWKNVNNDIIKAFDAFRNNSRPESNTSDTQNKNWYRYYVKSQYNTDDLLKKVKNYYNNFKEYTIIDQINKFYYFGFTPGIIDYLNKDIKDVTIQSTS